MDRIFIFTILCMIIELITLLLYGILTAPFNFKLNRTVSINNTCQHIEFESKQYSLMNNKFYIIKKCVIIQIISATLCSIVVYYFPFPSSQNFLYHFLSVLTYVPKGYIHLFDFPQLKYFLYFFIFLTILVTILFFKRRTGIIKFLFYFLYAGIWSYHGYFVFYLSVFSMPGNGSGILK